MLFYSNPTWSDGFLSCIEDIPLNIDIKENKQECFNFSSDKGKIVLAEANTTMQVIDIIRYYSKILPSFGWELKELSKEENYIIFNRDTDVLKISIKTIENKLYRISYNYLSLIK